MPMRAILAEKITRFSNAGPVVRCEGLIMRLG